MTEATSRCCYGGALPQGGFLLEGTKGQEHEPDSAINFYVWWLVEEWKSGQCYGKILMKILEKYNYYDARNILIVEVRSGKKS